MKIKGSKEFNNIEEIILSLKQLIQNGNCRGISCNKCIFCSDYAIDGGYCGENSILNDKNISQSLEKAKEILEEIKDNLEILLDF